MVLSVMKRAFAETDIKLNMTAQEIHPLLITGCTWFFIVMTDF